MNIFFASSSDIALDVFYEVLNKYTILGVLTSPDKPRGRGQKVFKNEIKSAAISSNIKVFDPINLDSDFVESVKLLKPDMMIVFSYGKIFKEEFLNIFPMGSINVHPSLLPKYRGPSPIQSSILNGDLLSGITVQKMALEMDSGNILVQEKFEIRSSDTSKDIFAYVKKSSPALVLKALEKVKKGYEGISQCSKDATFCFLLKKEMASIDFSSSAFEIKNKINAFNSWFPCRVKLLGSDIILRRADCINSNEFKNAQNGEIVLFDKNKGIFVKTGDGLLLILELQKINKKILDFKSFYNGNINIINKVFS